MRSLDLRPAHEELRQKLLEITSDLIGDRVQEQMVRVEALSAQYHHQIRIVQEADPNRPDTFQYTCFQHAFGLADPPEMVRRIATSFVDVYPSSQFVSFLIANDLQERTPDAVANGDVAVYWDRGHIKHAGLVEMPDIISKWGTAHLWRHRAFELPTSYGNQVRVFRPLSAERIRMLFLFFAQQEVGRDAVAACLDGNV